MKTNKRILNSLGFYFSLTVFIVLSATMTVIGSLFYLLNQLNWFNHKGTNLLVLFAGIALASIIIGTIFSLIVSRIPLRPFRTIIESMEKVTRGDFSVRLDFESPQELKNFSSSFNLMVKELSNTEILRSDFINSFSHEFKTPIISIKGFASLLKNPALSDKEKQEYLDIILEESERLTELSTNVLNLTRLENTEILTGLESCNLSEQIRRCLVLLESRWEKKKLDFDLDLKEVTVSAKVDLLQQMWLNLLDNAIKFSYEEGTIHIMLIESEQFVTVIIKDEGVGMNQDQASRIFRKFYQTDQGQQRGGNGLGLSVVKRIVELHHGRISVETKPNKGSSFTVSLPRKQ